MITRIVFLLFLSLFFFSCEKSKEKRTEYEVYKASGDITPKMDAFRGLLGELNTVPGKAAGRREINWDGIPDNMLDKTLPGNFFNPTGDQAPASLQRGLTYDDGEFQVSAAAFAHVNSLAATEFSPFSGTKVFANVNNNLWPIGFQVAGQPVAASVRAFGMVFSDVDLDNSTSLEFFDGEESLGRFFVPARAAGSSFSFLGVVFHNSVVSRVVVHHQGKLGDGAKDISQGGPQDLIVMDDMIYSEPQKR